MIQPVKGRNGDGASHDGPVRVAITGLGPITAVGVGIECLWQGLLAERSPIRRITRFDPTIWRSQLAAEIDDFQADRYMDPKSAKRLDRFTQFSVAASRMALDDAQLNPADVDPDRAAIQMG